MKCLISYLRCCASINIVCVLSHYPKFCICIEKTKKATSQECLYVIPAHQTSDMSRCTISPESRSKLEMVILLSLRLYVFLLLELFNMLITSSCVQISININ